MAFSSDLRKHLAEAAGVGGLSCNAAASSSKSASPAVRGSSNSRRQETSRPRLAAAIVAVPSQLPHRTDPARAGHYLPEIQELLIKNCGSIFRARCCGASSKCRRAATSGRAEAPFRTARRTARSRPCETCLRRPVWQLDQSGPEKLDIAGADGIPPPWAAWH